MIRRAFFATAKDLCHVFDAVESSRSVTYTLAGVFDTESLVQFSSGRTLPFSGSDAVESAALLPRYLVTVHDSRVVVRSVPQLSGEVKYAVDQLANPDSVTLVCGNICGTEILLPGEVGTVHSGSVAVETQRAFASAIGKGFQHIGSYWVGPEAARLAKNGVRLTASKRAPAIYDLAV